MKRPSWAAETIPKTKVDARRSSDCFRREAAPASWVWAATTTTRSRTRFTGPVTWVTSPEWARSVSRPLPALPLRAVPGLRSATRPGWLMKRPSTFPGKRSRATSAMVTRQEPACRKSQKTNGPGLPGSSDLIAVLISSVFDSRDRLLRVKYTGAETAVRRHTTTNRIRSLLALTAVFLQRTD
jgi:hypothetical protein